jgi:hypothetical protein
MVSATDHHSSFLGLLDRYRHYQNKFSLGEVRQSVIRKSGSHKIFLQTYMVQPFKTILLIALEYSESNINSAILLFGIFISSVWF